MGNSQSKGTSTLSNIKYKRVNDSSSEKMNNLQSKTSSHGCKTTPHSSVFYIHLQNEDKNTNEKK